jgi:molybdopterin-guanine dinucleotide biosynthesis protein A
VVGLFVGGRSSRMGGFPKGNLRAPSSELTLLERLLAQLHAASPGLPVVLVGQASAYASLGLHALCDRPAGIGPLGGLAALLDHAGALGAAHVVALACDLPRLSSALIGRLLNDEPHLEALAAEQDAVRNPLIARYAVAPANMAVAAVLASGKRSLQAVLDQLDTGSLRVSGSELAELDDWDSPSDA